MFLLDIPVIKFFMEIFSRFFPTEGFFFNGNKTLLEIYLCVLNSGFQKAFLAYIKKDSQNSTASNIDKSWKGTPEVMLPVLLSGRIFLCWSFLIGRWKRSNFVGDKNLTILMPTLGLI